MNIIISKAISFFKPCIVWDFTYIELTNTNYSQTQNNNL